MSLRARFIREVGWATVERWCRAGLSFVVFGVLARLLEPSAFGQVALAGVYIAFVQIFVTQGFGTALVQRKELEQEHLDTAFWVSLSAALILAGLTMITAPLAASWLSYPGLTPVLRVLSITFPISALGVVPGAILARNMAFYRLAIRAISGVAVGGGVGVMAAVMDWGVWALVAQSLVGSFAGTLWLWLATSWRPAMRVSRRHLSDLRTMGLALMGSQILWFFSRKGDEAIVGSGLGPAVLGSYSVANHLVTMAVEMLTSPIQVVAVPAMSRVQGDRRRLGNALADGTVVSAAIACPAFIGLLLVAPQVVPFVFGPQWVPAVPVVQVLCVAAICRSFSVMHHPALLALGRPWTYFNLLAVHAGVTVLASILTVRTGKAEWVALSQVIANAVSGAANLCLLVRATSVPVRRLVRECCGVIVPCMAMSAVVLSMVRMAGVHAEAPTVVVGSIVMGASTYVLVAWFTLGAVRRRVLNEMRSSRHPRVGAEVTSIALG